MLDIGGKECYNKNVENQRDKLSASYLSDGCSHHDYNMRVEAANLNPQVSLW